MYVPDVHKQLRDPWMVQGYQSNYGNYGWSRDTKETMASTDTLTRGWSRDTRVTMASTDTLTRGVDQYILVTMDGPGIPE